MTTLMRKSATSTTPGELSLIAQTIVGDKTFTGLTTLQGAVLFGNGGSGQLYGSPLGVYANSGQTPFPGRFLAMAFNGVSVPLTMGVALNNGFPYMGFNSLQSAGDNQAYAQTGNPAMRMYPTSNSLQIDVAPAGTAGGTITWRTALQMASTGGTIIGPITGLTGGHTLYGGHGLIGNEVISVRKTAVSSQSNNNLYMAFVSDGNNDGFLQTNGSAVLTIVDVSDARKKENIRPAEYGLNTIMQLKPVSFDWINGPKSVKGFIAQDVELVLPESVSIVDESAKGGYTDSRYLETLTMIPVLVKAVQDLKNQLDEKK